jgi:hypothetical protein
MTDMIDQANLKLNEEESKAITTLHRQAQEIVHAIGQAEVHKAKLLSQLADIEERAQGAMNGVGARLGIPQGVPWQIRPDGTVIIVDPKTGQPVPPAPRIVTP